MYSLKKCGFLIFIGLGRLTANDSSGFCAQMESNIAAGALQQLLLMQARSQLPYRVLRVSEYINRVYKQRDDAWRFYITLVSAVTDDNADTSLSFLDEKLNEAEQRRMCEWYIGRWLQFQRPI